MSDLAGRKCAARECDKPPSYHSAVLLGVHVRMIGLCHSHRTEAYSRSVWLKEEFFDGDDDE